jgi:hypothetical protein
MALSAETRFSDNEGITAEERVDRAFERSGLGPGLTLLACIALAIVLFGGTIGLGHPAAGTIATTDKSLDRGSSNHPFTNVEHSVTR